MYPYNFKFGQTIQTDVDGVSTDRGFISHFQVSAAGAATQSITGVLAATALTAAEQDIAAGITNPPAPRNIKIKANAATVTGNVVITGTNYADTVITETIALNGTAEVLGNKSFKTVTNIHLPVEINVGTDTVSVGFGNKLGLPYKLSLNTILSAYRDGTLESTAPTVAVSATAIESNTVSLNSALNGTAIDVFLIV